MSISMTSITVNLTEHFYISIEIKFAFNLNLRLSLDDENMENVSFIPVVIYPPG
jgi:hypothetical protein